VDSRHWSAADHGAHAGHRAGSGTGRPDGPAGSSAGDGRRQREVDHLLRHDRVRGRTRPELCALERLARQSDRQLHADDRLRRKIVEARLHLAAGHRPGWTCRRRKCADRHQPARRRSADAAVRQRQRRVERERHHGRSRARRRRTAAARDLADAAWLPQSR
jgi:hypothetical protein